MPKVEKAIHQKKRNLSILSDYRAGVCIQDLMVYHSLSRATIYAVLRSLDYADRSKRNLEILSDFQSGHDRSYLAEKYSLSLPTISEILIRYGEKAYKTGPERKPYIIQLVFAYMANPDINKLSTDFAIPQHTVYRLLRERGVSVLSDKQAKRSEIADMLGRGLTDDAVADMAKTTKEHVQDVRRKTTGGWRPEVLKCKACGTAFVPSCYRQTLCSTACQKKNNYEETKRRHLTRKVSRKCEWCAGSFMAFRYSKPRRRFCSPACAKKQEYKSNIRRNEEIFYLRHTQGLTYSRIGEIFGIDSSTARYTYKKQLLEHNRRVLELSENAKAR